MQRFQLSLPRSPALMPPLPPLPSEHNQPVEKDNEDTLLTGCPPADGQCAGALCQTGGTSAGQMFLLCPPDGPAAGNVCVHSSLPRSNTELRLTGLCFMSTRPNYEQPLPVVLPVRPFHSTEIACWIWKDSNALVLLIKPLLRTWF